MRVPGLQMRGKEQDGPLALMLINSPSPDRNVVLGRLHGLLRLEVIYLGTGASAGWGGIAAQHPHQIAKDQFDACRLILSKFWNEDIDVVVVHGYRSLPQIVCLTLARLSRKQVIVRSDTNIDSIQLQDKFTRVARRFLMYCLVPRSSIAWTIGSKNSLAWSQEFGIHSQVRIPFEIDQSASQSDVYSRPEMDHEGTLRVIFVGRLIECKRVDTAIGALRLLPPGYDWEFHIAGDGPERSRLERLARGDERIIFHGRVEHGEILSLLSNFDVLLLPSSYEAWGLVVNEALSVGVRVLVSNMVGAGADLVTAENGGIFTSGSEEELAQLLIGCYGKPRPLPLQQPDTAMMMFESISGIRKSRANRHRRKGLATPPAVPDNS